MARPSDPESKLPSYEESIVNRAEDSYSDDREGESAYASNSFSGRRILDRLTLVREQHIRSIVDEHVCPLLEQQAMYGIAKTTIALIPSNAASLDPETCNAAEVIGPPSAGQAEQVRLEGQLNRTEFWRQPEVAQELQRALQERLSTFPLLPDRRDGTGSTAAVSPPQRRGLFGRKFGSAASELQSTPRVRGEKLELPCGRVHIQVKLEEFYLRTMLEFGLYETVGRPMVVVRVDLRS